MVAEVVSVQAETLSAETNDERSRPTYTPLPKGTIDYCEKQADGFYTLRSGVRLYEKDLAFYNDVLPAQNNVRFLKSEIIENQLKLEFAVDYKAPFTLSFGEQEYKNISPQNSARPDYTVQKFTSSEIVIKFLYCPEIKGNVTLPSNALFSSSLQNEEGKLSLKLKTQNLFCGYTAEYNEQGNLCFYFLNPTPIERADNRYGYSLKGKKIILDAGHGGADPGAVGESEAYSEANLNLILTNAIKNELESVGAEVILTRTEDKHISLADRRKMIYKIKPDLFISVHRNAAEREEATGYENYYFYPFSKPLADCVFSSASKTFSRQISTKYYPFYVNRATSCPSILTENGFVSNSEELSQLKIYKNNLNTARATTEGIISYFKTYP